MKWHIWITHHWGFYDEAAVPHSSLSNICIIWKYILLQGKKNLNVVWILLIIVVVIDNNKILKSKVLSKDGRHGKVPLRCIRYWWIKRSCWVAYLNFVCIFYLEMWKESLHLQIKTGYFLNAKYFISLLWNCFNVNSNTKRWLKISWTIFCTAFS